MYYMLQNVCQLALIVKCSYFTQKAACNAFIKLIELFEDYDLNFAETINKFIDIFKATEEKGENIGLELCTECNILFLQKENGYFAYLVK